MNYQTLSNIVVRPEMAGKTVEEKFYSETLDKNWYQMIYYPAGYKEERKYPVIYLLHGAYGTHRDFKDFGEAQVMLDRAIASSVLPPCIAVMPDGMDAWYSDTEKVKIRTAFEKDLFPHVEKNYPTLNKKSSRAIGGLSMGGHGTLVFALRNPSYFNFAFVMSPATTNLKTPPPSVKKLEKDFSHVFGKRFSQEIWDELSYHKPFENYLQQKDRLNFLVINGTDDIITPVKNSRELSKDLKNNGIEHAYIEVPSASHSWAFWNMALGLALEHAGKFLSEK